MTPFLIICGVLGTYSMLSMLGGERQRRSDELQARFRSELKTAPPDAACSAAPTPVPVAPFADKKPAPAPRAVAAKPSR